MSTDCSCAVQNNRYQLQQMSYLQFEEKPRHVPECLRDLTAMYDAIAVPDLYQVIPSLAHLGWPLSPLTRTAGPQVAEMQLQAWQDRAQAQHLPFAHTA